MTNNYFRAAI